MELCISKVFKLQLLPFFAIIRPRHSKLLRFDNTACFELREWVSFAARANMSVLWLLFAFTASIEPMFMFVYLWVGTTMAVITWVIWIDNWDSCSTILNNQYFISFGWCFRFRWNGHTVVPIDLETRWRALVVLPWFQTRLTSLFTLFFWNLMEHSF